MQFVYAAMTITMIVGTGLAVAALVHPDADTITQLLEIVL